MEKNFKAKDKYYDYLVSIPIIIAIISLIGQIFLQSTITLVDNVYSFPQTISLLFSSSALAFIGLSNTFDLSLIQGVSAVINILIALILLFLSSYSLKGNKLYLLIAFAIYAFDTLIMLILFIISGLGIYVLSFRIQDYIIMSVIHILGLAVMGYTIFPYRRNK